MPEMVPGPTYGSSTFTLDNGLEVVVVPIANAPVVHMQFTYRVGSNDEEPGKTGLAHYLEHLMFRAGQKANAGHLEQIAQAGGSSNAYTSYEVTSYYNSIPPEKLEETLKREAERIATLTNDSAAAAIELDVVKREKTQRGDSTGAKFREKLSAALWQDHPYARAIIGTDADLNTLNLVDSQAFHKKWYGVSNVGLVLTGKTNAADAYKLVTKLFGDLPKSQVPVRRWLTSPIPQTKPDNIIMRGPDVGAPALLRARVLAIKDVDTPQNAAAISVAMAVMTGSADARLTRPLVYGDPIATNVYFSIIGHLNNAATVELSASPLDPQELDLLDKRLTSELAKALAKPVTQAEVDRIKKRLLAQFDQTRDKPAYAASAFSNGFAAGWTPDQVEHWPDALRNVDAARVNAILADVLAPGPWIEGRLLPRERDVKPQVPPASIQSKPASGAAKKKKP
jgi:zinc protease